MPRLRPMLSFLLLPLLAAGVAGLRLGHEVVAHEASIDGSTESGGCGGHRACGSGQRSTQGSADDSTTRSPSAPGDGDCRDCDLLAASIGAASLIGDDASGVMVAVAQPSPELERFSIDSPEVERARPPPV